MLANYLFAVLMPVCVCVSAVVTCECVDLDSCASAAGLLALHLPCAFSGSFGSVSGYLLHVVQDVILYMYLFCRNSFSFLYSFCIIA